MSASRSMPADAPGRGAGLGEGGGGRGMLARIIDHAAELLPQQGPITVFIHHNTLHALEDLPFPEALRAGAGIFGCQTYLGEDRYREALRLGRIRFAELREVLEEDLGGRASGSVPGFGTRLDLRLAMLEYPLRTGPTDELIWHVAETDALRRVRPEVSSATRARLIAETRRWVMRDLRRINGTARPRAGSRAQAPTGSVGLAELLERFGEARIEDWNEETWERFTLQALWRVCCDGVRDRPFSNPRPAESPRHRDLLLEATGEDSDVLVNEVLIRFCAAFLDQGLAAWKLPGRDRGFLRAFASLYRRPAGPPASWRRGLAAELARIDDRGIGALESIGESLEDLGVDREEWEPFVRASLLALRGWAGMVGQIEKRGDRVVRPVPSGSLVEYLAVRLLLERQALAYLARTTGIHAGPLRTLREAIRPQSAGAWPPSVEQRAFPVFQLAQVAGLSPEVLHRLDPAEWSVLLDEIESFAGMERRRVFQLAYERRFLTRALDAIELHSPGETSSPESSRPTPRFQAVFCLDDREESFRRHLEELAPGVETFGTAGFFSVPMYYRGVGDAHFVPLCPAVVRPRHWVVERAVEETDGGGRRRARARRFLGMASHRIHTGSRSLTQGAFLAALGVLATAPLVARTLFPRLTARLRRSLGRMVLAPPLTRLQLERTAADPGPEGGAVGFSLGEMAEIAEKVLREIGLTANFARFVLILGHGSTSMNNPHESAYDCGACGGARGGPNARALAQILNDPRVRGRLAAVGIAIPAETHFVGGLHNTSSEAVTFHDGDLIPAADRREFDEIREIVRRARELNAQERCRRFLSAPLNLSASGARQHVEGRAEDLAQARPEAGHATNALTIVGRRALSRGLFLDRRAFLASYEPDQDDADFTILGRILSAVFPVCAGISLEYYFSYVDNTGWGSGTKLRHNISALVGVMDGYRSDLRTGLPWQMVEIHEPMRPLFVIETTPEAMLRIMGRDEGIGRLCARGWVVLALVDPRTRGLSVYRDGAFVPYGPRSSRLPRAESSRDWYRGWRDHLEFAEIGTTGDGSGMEGIAASPLSPAEISCSPDEWRA